MAFGNFSTEIASMMWCQNPIGRHKKNLKNISVRQHRPLKNLDVRSVRILDEVFLPQWVREILTFGPKHPVRDKFNEINFLADIDRFFV